MVDIGWIDFRIWGLQEGRDIAVLDLNDITPERGLEAEIIIKGIPPETKELVLDINRIHPNVKILHLTIARGERAPDGEAQFEVELGPAQLLPD